MKVRTVYCDKNESYIESCLVLHCRYPSQVRIGFETRLMTTKKMDSTKVSMKEQG